MQKNNDAAPCFVGYIAAWVTAPTWEYFDAAMMSVLTFATAPWAVGTLYRAWQERRHAKQAYVAACLWLFSASWCYDLYLVFRDGRYPDTWAANMAASSILSLLAGMLWLRQAHVVRAARDAPRRRADRAVPLGRVGLAQLWCAGGGPAKDPAPS